MTTAASNLLNAFDALPLSDQQSVAVEILRRSASSNEVNAQAYDELAADVFGIYDAEEASGADS
jgi:hypothetical protein